MPSFSHEPLYQRAWTRVGTVVQKKYRINRLIGVGGMAAVYAAVHRNGHRVAIKFLLDHLLGDSDIHRLFAREAYVANRVGHPGAVPVLDDDVDEEGCPFLIMPLLEGETLRARWERTNKRLPIFEVGVLMMDALDVLASAHAKGIIHRDIKPDNLFVTTKGNVRVLDFGIARSIEGGSTGTVTGRMMGTPAFLPPEQALGERDAMGPHSDCWAAGATIATLLSGQFVHRTDNPVAQLAAAATRHAPSLAELAPDMPSSIVQFVDKALAFAPEDRWRSGQEMRAAFQTALEGALGQPMADIAVRVRAELVAELTPKVDDADAFATQRPGRASLEGAHGERPRTQTAHVMRAGHELRSNAWRLALGGMAALSIGGAVWASTFRKPVPSAEIEPTAVSSGAANTDESTSGNPKAQALLSAGLQSWRDASRYLARKSFEGALEIEPDLAAAHLYSVLLSMNDDEGGRRHLQAALLHREHLSVRDRALLDAYAPAVTVPRDLDACVQRLATVRERFPSDWLASITLARVYLERNECAKTVEVLDDLLLREPSLAMAWADKGRAFWGLEDPTNMHDSLNECLRLSPYAEQCLEQLMQMAQHEGRCADAERYARTLMSFPSTRRWWAIGLAGAIVGRGGTMESAREVLENMGGDPRHGKPELPNFNVLVGSFDEAQRSLDAKQQELAGERYGGDREDFVKSAFYVALELGDHRRTVRLTSEYLSKHDAWFMSEYSEGEILPLRIQYLADGFSHEEFEKRRRIWLARAGAHYAAIYEKNAVWQVAYAQAAKTHDDAVEALRVLPQYLPATGPFSPFLESKGAFGYVYLLAGDAEKAIPYLRSAASACRAIEAPFEHTWAHLHLGMALEQTGDMPGACAAYDVVLKRWGKEPRSVSAKAARMRHAALHCPAVAP
ncbi:MAG TPA: protein kinase [Polyangiaceae bacterium]|nr:protein kinase [Polyangiaceae bacterium]